MLMKTTLIASITPTNQKYHDQSPLTRWLLVASAWTKLAGPAQRVPNFYPAHWPLGALFWYLVLIVAGIYSGLILWLLTRLSGNALLAVGTPVLIAVLEFLVVPALKYPSLRNKTVANMKAFVAEDRAARESAAQAATAWTLRDWLALLILVLCFVAKVLVLLNFGAYAPPAVLAWNYSIAIFDFACHAGGLTTRVPCFLAARFTDWMHLRNRRTKGYTTLTEDGKEELGSLPCREFPFTTPVPISFGTVDGHTIEFLGHDERGFDYRLLAAGTLDDTDREAFLNCQPNKSAQSELATALARIQLELLTAPEMRPLQRFAATPAPENDGGYPNTAHA